MHFLRHHLIFTLLLVLALLQGCGQTGKDTEAIDTYRTETESALAEISSAYDRLEALDKEDAADTDEFLTAIDNLRAAMEKAAAIEAPEAFSDAQSLLQKASSDMNKAADDFSSALSSDSPDEDLLKQASSEYRTAQDTLQSAITSLRDAGCAS